MPYTERRKQTTYAWRAQHRLPARLNGAMLRRKADSRRTRHTTNKQRGDIANRGYCPGVDSKCQSGHY